MDADIAAKLGLPALEKGWVWLVGAGPGDPGLITALGLVALADADYVLYDALVDEKLLALSRAEKIYAGKRAGVRSCKQDEISQLLVDLARRERPDARLASFNFKAVRPTFDLHPFRVSGRPTADGKGAQLWAQDHEGWLTMQGEATFA